ncbi:hypothetical protein O0L34_g12613 [Tuta absoluta]|nr:hypothetical protein O0L34_g12613 [Tuta absoluta]
MSPVITLMILGTALIHFSSSAHIGMSCEEFSQGAAFSFDQTLGTWHILSLRPSNDPGGARCARFLAIDEQERNDLQGKFGKLFPDVKWENLALKMQFPCVMDSGLSNKTRVVYLERLGGDGSYLTLLIPKSTKSLDNSQNRHKMKFKLVERKYLAMMDCHEHVTFVLDRQPHDKPLEPALVNILKPYLPQEH